MPALLVSIFVLLCALRGANGVQICEPLNGERLIYEHNNFRAKHGSPDVTWNAELAEVAKKDAEELRSEANCTSRSYNGLAGTNYLTTPIEASPYQAVETWYTEGISDWDFTKVIGRHGSNKVYAFTQIIWRDTSEIGCARACCATTSVIVCKYLPSGNIPGLMAENIHGFDDHFYFEVKRARKSKKKRRKRH